MTVIIDATGLVLGRMATQIAKRALGGETIHIVNADKAIISGTTKAAIREEYMRRYQLGTYRKGPFMSRMPHDLVKRTIRGMLPYQKPHGRDALKRIKAHIGVPPELAGQPTESVDGARRAPHGITITVGELAAALGAPHRPEAA
jgi:large subunit ribosomal protein L13